MSTIKAEKGLILNKGKPLKPATLRTDKARLRHIADHFGDQRARDVTPVDVEHGVERNPCHGIDRPADGKRNVRLTAAQYRALGDAIRRAEGSVPWQARYAARLIALTACRHAEILELQWSEVDFAGRCVRLDDSKTGRSVRPLPDAAAELLAEIAEYSAGNKWVFPAANHTEKNRHFMGFTLCWHRMLPDELRRLPPSDEPLTPHGLRHAYASLAHDMGIGELTIAHILGHSAGRGTTRGYIHGVDAIARSEANRVASAIASYLDGSNVVPMLAAG
jgi:integrase